MTLAFWTAVGGAVIGFAALLIGFFDRRKAHEDGQVVQAGKEAAVAAVVGNAIAEAEVKAPDTKDEVIARLKKRAF